MNLKITLVALSLAMAVPAMAQTTDSTPDGCHGAAAGTVLSDGTVCPAGGTGTLGSNITPLSGTDDDDGLENEGADDNGTDNDTADDNGSDQDSADDNSSDHDSASGSDDNGTDHDSASGNDDTGSDHDSDSDNGDDD